MAATQSLFDVGRFRSEPHRLVLVRSVTTPTLVLGSTQPADVVDVDALRTRGVALSRRRGGGGAVYLEPDDPLWVDCWIPRSDPLWNADVAAAAAWVGAWWADALEQLGLSGLEVHAGRARPGELGDLICFAGRGPGEVFFDGQKVVGLSQWRSREGALFSSCAYLHWDATSMLAVLDLREQSGDALVRELATVALGLAGIVPPVVRDLAAVRHRLLASFPGFELTARGDGRAPSDA